MNTILFKKLRSDATIPSRGSEFAAGLDLYAVETTEIGIGKTAIIPTGIATAIPENTYLRIAPRSGMAAKNAIDVLAGVVDQDYRGELKVILVNHGDKSFIVKPGDRIAQAVIERIAIPDIINVGDQELPASVRGADGFGSTGS